MQSQANAEHRSRALVLRAAGRPRSEIARELGVSTSTVSRWLNPKNELEGGLCECGCGRRTSIDVNTWQPRRFATGHNGSQRRGPDYTIDENGCWIWQRGLTYKGYGACNRDGFQTAHRWYYAQLVGQIPEGMQLDHLCRVRACVNPGHLEPVTAGENTRRGLNAKITWKDVQAMRASGESTRVLAERYELAQTYVWSILNYRSWGAPGIRAKEAA